MRVIFHTFVDDLRLYRPRGLCSCRFVHERAGMLIRGVKLMMTSD